MGTKSRIVIYQHLFVHFCTFAKGTIGYNGYNGSLSHLFNHIFQKASNTNNLRGARTWFTIFIFYFIRGRVYKGMFRKKSKYKHVSINKKKYYFYKISWVDITSDGGHATAEEFDKFECAKMVTFAYVYKRNKKFIWTFASYDQKDEAYSDRNVFPIKCITKMEKLNV